MYILKVPWDKEHFPNTNNHYAHILEEKGKCVEPE
jgi:hypothetical protein